MLMKVSFFAAKSWNNIDLVFSYREPFASLTFLTTIALTGPHHSESAVNDQNVFNQENDFSMQAIKAVAICHYQSIINPSIATVASYFPLFELQIQLNLFRLSHKQ